jgi:hypothetical protein
VDASGRHLGDDGPMGAILLIGAALVVVALLVAVVVLSIARSWTNARVAALVAGLIVILYGVAMVVVGTQVLVTEGGFPSLFVIGDDNSLLHPQPAWPLS